MERMSDDQTDERDNTRADFGFMVFRLGSVNVLMPTTSARERVYLEGCVRHSPL